MRQWVTIGICLCLIAGAESCTETNDSGSEGRPSTSSSFAPAPSQSSLPATLTSPETKSGRKKRFLAGLLTIEDVAGGPGAPLGMTQVDSDAMAIEDNPDPRGPCGAKVYQPSLATAVAGAFFQSQGTPPTRVMHVLWDLPPGLSTRAVKDLRRDVEPGCPPFRSITPYGFRQKAQFVDRLPVSGGDLNVAVIVEVQAPGQPPAFAYTVLVSEGDLLSAMIIFSAAPLPLDYAGELGDTAAKRLEPLTD